MNASRNVGASGLMRTAQSALTCKLSSDLCYGSIFTSFSRLQNLDSFNKRELSDLSIEDYYQNYANVVVKKQNPLLNRFYFLRQQLLHYSFLKLLSAPSRFSNTSDIQILLLGGGLDVSYEFYNHSTNNLRYYVIDFEEVIEKRRLYHMKRNTYSNKGIEYVAGDLLDFQKILLKLESYPRFNFNQPTIVIFECVLSYLPAAVVSEISSKLSSTFAACSVLIYDPLLGTDDDNNPDYFHQMKKCFENKDANLMFCPSTIEDFSLFLYQSGWNHVDSMTIFQRRHLGSFSNIIDPLITSSLESFDEYSSLQLLLTSYHITVCTNSSDWFNRYSDVLLLKDESIFNSNTSFNANLSMLFLKLDWLEKKVNVLEKLHIQKSTNVDMKFR
jgi:tRNA wybutosine-synthesizing protein 4